MLHGLRLLYKSQLSQVNEWKEKALLKLERERVIKLSPAIIWKVSNVFYSLVNMLEDTSRVNCLLLTIPEKELHEELHEENSSLGQNLPV